MASAVTLTFPNPKFPQQDQPVTVGSPLPVSTTPVVSTAAHTTTVEDTTENVVILAANDGRRGAVVFNTASTVLYLKLGDGVVSVTSFTYRLPQNAFIEVPFSYTGVIKGMWATDAGDGAAVVTEFL